MDESDRKEYNPYQWPPDMILAHLHARCSMPGKQNPDGEECPCCLRREKMKTTNWFSRNLYKDFKYYGGGVSGYFGLMAYYAFSAIAIILIAAIYHIICIQHACTERAIKTYQCVKLFKFIKIMSPFAIRNSLEVSNPSMVQWLSLVYFVTFVFLLLITFATMEHLKRIESKLTKSIRIFSHYSLIFKNIPRFMNLAQFKDKLLTLYPDARIKEVFFLHKTSDYYETHHKLIQIYYNLQYFRMNENLAELRKLEPLFVKYMEQLQELKKKFQKSTGKAIVVFEEQTHKEYFQQAFTMPKFRLFTYHLGRMLKVKEVKEMGMYSDKIAEPGEIIWKYIGEGSIAKTKVRIITGLLSIVFLLVCAAIIYYPMHQANETQDESEAIIYNIISAFGLLFFNILYRVFMSKLTEYRKPNTYLSLSLFVIMTTVFFHLLFYLYIPVIYYAMSPKLASVKLRTLFFQVLIFVIASVLIAAIDFKYCMFNGRLTKHLRNTSTSNKYCQRQLHENLNYPSFPIEFKMMVMYKLWSFTVFYAFQIPEILFLFVPLMVFLYFGDKFRVYTRYKMNSYLPIQLEKDFERPYIYIYIVTLCLSYLLTATQTWQFCIAPLLVVGMIGLRMLLDRRDKQAQNNQFVIKKSQTLSNVLKTFSFKHNLQNQMFDSDSQRMSLSAREQDSMTMKTVDSFTSGYKQMYDNFLHQFQAKRMNQLLDQEDRSLRRRYRPRVDSEMVNMQ